MHHGILHTREHFLSFIDELNAQGFHVAMIDQQSENASRKNCIGLDAYVTGMEAACKQIEEEQNGKVSGFIYHSMGAAIGERMQGKSENNAWRLPTVFITPIPVLGAWPIFKRLLAERKRDLFWAIVNRSVRSLAQTEDDVRQLFFTDNAPTKIVRECKELLKHSPFYAYLQLTLRRFSRIRINHNGQRNMLITSDEDYIFAKSEYEGTKELYLAGRRNSDEEDWLTVEEMPGGHDLFMVDPQVTAKLIALFFRDIWKKPGDDGPLRIDPPHNSPPHRT